MNDYLGVGTLLVGVITAGVGIAKSSKTAIIAGGILALLGAFLLGKRYYAQPSGVKSQLIAPPTEVKPVATYSNIEEIEFPQGFDPETFMPRKIVIHRKAQTRNG